MTRAEKVAQALKMMFPEATVELHHRNAFELLVAVVLSAQTTDVAVNKVTPGLFAAYPDAKAIMDADIIDLENHIRTIGLFHNKAKNIKALSEAIVLNHGGIVPNDRKSLELLAGVGRKTANVVLSNAFGIPAFAVDTHVSRVAMRLGLAKPGDSVRAIEDKLMRKFPKSQWQSLHHQMIFFGRYHCLAKSPRCDHCPLHDVCVFSQKKPYEGS